MCNLVAHNAYKIKGNEGTHQLQLKYSKALMRLGAKNAMLKARNLRMSAHKRNSGKVARRSKDELDRVVQEQHTVLKSLEELTTQLKQQGVAREGKNKQHRSILDRYQQSKKCWKRRARAAEKSRRYMLAKAGKTTVPKRCLKTKHSGAYRTRIRSLSRRLIMAGVSAI